jgi:hypothetical protein
MVERIRKELDLLRTRYHDLEYIEEGQWVRGFAYPLPDGWNRSETDIAFPIPIGYPGTPPYGIYTPAGLLYNGKRPNNYQEPAPNRPPFTGIWGVFSWTTKDGQWRAATDLDTGWNLLNWVMGFRDRFLEGV